MRRPIRSIAAALAAVFGLLAPAAPAWSGPEESGGNKEAEKQSETDEADAPSTPEYQKVIDKGRDAYNANDYAKAARHYVRAAQLAPQRPQPYRNLARTYFWKKEYTRAVVFYDYYLKLVPDARDVQKVKRERKLAAQRAGDDVWQRPDSQTRVLSTLRDTLTEGNAYTKGGGGAWALYKTLIRTGYAAPDLARLKQRVRKKLIDEFEGLLMTGSSQPVPILSLEEWQRQQMRLEAARSIARDSSLQKVIDRRMRIVDTAIALLNGRYDDAADLSEEALESNPDMPFVHWYRMTALAHAGRYDEARTALEVYRKNLDEGTGEQKRYLEIMEAILAHRRGDPEKAAELYRNILE